MIWRGLGFLAPLYWIAGVMLGGIAKSLIPGVSFTAAGTIGMILGAVGIWFHGVHVNRTAPQKDIEKWSVSRRAELDTFVGNGTFTLGPGYPIPKTVAEARAMSNELFEAEVAALNRTLFNQHTLLFIPMQYTSFIFAGLSILGLF